MNLEKEVFEISLKDIMPNRFQPREVFDDEALQELAISIKEHGVIQPIIVRKVGDKYEIIAGERRFRASQLAGKETIPALVRDIDDKEAAKIALLENLQRKDLTAIEEARTYETILKLDNITQEELAANLGKSQSTIANKLRLLNLDESVQTALLNEKISERHARSLLNLTNPDQQKELLEKVILNRMTVRELDEEIQKMTGRNVTLPEEYTLEKNIIEQPNIQNIEDTVNIMENINQDTIKTTNNIYQPTNDASQFINHQNQTYMPNNIENKTNEQSMPNEKIEPFKPEIKPEQLSFEQQPEPVSNVFTSLRVNTPEQLTPINQASNAIIEQAPKMETPDKFESQIIENNNINLNPERIIPRTPQENPFTGIPIQNIPSKEQINSGIYDLRFAINNVRQAVQNTEKFGFSIETQEFDFENIYQIVIKIDKNKTE